MLTSIGSEIASDHVILMHPMRLNKLSRVASSFFIAMSLRSSSTSTVSSFCYNGAFFNVPVLYQDDKLLVINKPPGMMSVPGNEILTLMKVQPRNQQWRDALISLWEDGLSGAAPRVGSKRPLSCIINNEDMEPIHKILQLLIDKGENVPRKEDRFSQYLQRAFKIYDQDLKLKIFRALVQRDDEMHRITIDTIPGHLVSAFDVASHVADDFVRNPVNIIPTYLTESGWSLVNEQTTELTEATPTDNPSSEQSTTSAKRAEVHQQKVHPVHRLDMETSGVLLFAKDEHTSATIDAQFRDREVSKVYVARILGRPKHRTFTVSCPIRPDLRIRPYQIVDAVGGKTSVTECQLIEDDSEEGRLYASLFPPELIGCDDAGQPLESSLIELKPLSGRTHQLRVHMAHIGHPILGDTLYPIPKMFREIAAAADKATAAAVAATLSSDSGVVEEPLKEAPGTVLSKAPSPSAEDDMLDLLTPLEGRVVLTPDSAPPVLAPRVDAAFPRLCLHALRLSFAHPVTKASTTLTALSTAHHDPSRPSEKDTAV